MLNEPSCPGPAAPPTRARRAVTAAAVSLLVLALCGSRTAAAQAFQLPQACRWGATGSEGMLPGQGDDPVVLVVRGSNAVPVTSFSMFSFGKPPAWWISISPFQGGTYLVVTTYTPFLTSSVFIDDSNPSPSYPVALPPPGVSAGSQWSIHDTFTVTIMNAAGSQPLPNAYVDFIPEFVGASPLTMQADGNGNIVLHCVQSVSTGYDITVYDSSHTYLYDGSFSTNATTSMSVDAVSGGLTGHAQTRPHGQP